MGRRNGWELEHGGRTLIEIVRGTDTVNSSIYQQMPRNILSYDRVLLSFDYKVTSFENGENFSVEVNYDDGTGWVSVQVFTVNLDFQNSVKFDHSNEKQARIEIPIINKTSVRIRFVNNGSGTGDFLFLDNIVLVGEIKRS